MNSVIWCISESKQEDAWSSIQVLSGPYPRAKSLTNISDPVLLIIHRRVLEQLIRSLEYEYETTYTSIRI